MYAYIHIPFCEKKCTYCRFASFAYQNQERIDFYIQFLLNTIKNSPPSNHKLDSIYFGGGTPSYISPQYIAQIIETLKKKFGFSDEIEISLETTPQNVIQENEIIWKESGINRISMGIQSFHEKTLQELKREEKRQIFQALQLLEKDTIDNISVDFIIGLPFVEKGGVKNDIQYLLEQYNYVKHISVYMLEDYYYGEKWKNLVLKEEDFLDEYLEIKTFLERKGFFAYELSNFAKRGYECKHNKAYWEHKEILAYGLDAHGYCDGVRYAYPSSFKDFYAGKMQYEEKLSIEEKNIEMMLFQLRTQGIEKKLFQFLDMQKVYAFVKDGYLQQENEKLMLGEKGYTLLDYILKEIIV